MSLSILLPLDTKEEGGVKGSHIRRKYGGEQTFRMSFIDRFGEARK